ncbi:MAG: hypothetical protein DWP95_06580 [Proteobacteria bacterium]|nr:MAG: hypothetical protein DWP95_06580 [Pseudomonadota bacterium]
MRLCLLINPTDHWQHAVKYAHQLAMATEDKHQLIGVFFYGTAANIITDSQEQSKWQSLAKTPLYICRTMMDDFKLSDESLEQAFTVIGMAPWIGLMEQADRIVEII